MGSSDGISIVDAQFIGVISECILYGLFTALFLAVLYLLVTKRGTNNSIILVSSTVALFLVATAHLVDKVIQVYTAFCRSQDGGPASYYSDFSRPTQIAEGTLVPLQILIGDTVLVYRLYVVWGKVWYVAVLPGLLTIGGAVCGFGSTAAASRATTPTIFAETVPQWMIATAATTFTTNFLCSSLIALKIYRSLRATSQSSVTSRAGSLTRVALSTVIESAAIYLAAVAAFLVLTVIGSDAQFLILDIEPAIIGITFSVIIIRACSVSSSAHGSHSNSSRLSVSSSIVQKPFDSLRPGCHDLEEGNIPQVMTFVTGGHLNIAGEAI